MALFKETETTTLHVGGMHCQKCVARVKDALESVDGVVSAQVNLEEERAVVEGTASPEQLVSAITALDFTAEVA